MTTEEAAQKTSAALNRFGPIAVQGLLTIGLFILGYWLNGQAQAQSAFNARLASVEQVAASTVSDLRVVQNTISNRGAARDQQLAGITGQVSVLDSRVDRVEASFDGKLDKLVDAVSKLQSQVAGLSATIRSGIAP